MSATVNSENHYLCGSLLDFIMDKAKKIRYVFSVFMVILMVGLAEWAGEKEIIFPEMAALTIGMWVIDKRVWKVRRWQMIWMMTAGAVAGVCIVRYSPLPLLCNLCMAFTFAACCLMFSRTTLIPLISACMLPVLLHTETWIYPTAVFFLTVILVSGQRLMEKAGLRKETNYAVPEREWKKESCRWGALLFFVSLVAAFSLFCGYAYFIIPPLIVTFTEIVNSKAGFRNRPMQVFLFLVTGASLGTAFQIVGHSYLHLPETIVALSVICCLFAIFEWTGKYFAPAGALALIPLIIPQEGIRWLPLQAAIGAALFITIGMLVFQQCYKWSEAQLVFCFTPTLLRRYLNRRRKE